MKQYCLILLFSFGWLASAGWPTPSLAWSLTPARTVISIAPSSTQVMSLVINSDKEFNQDFTWSARGAVQDDNGRPRFESGIEKAENWVTAATTTIVVPGKGQANFSFLITAPPDALPGTHFVGIVIKPKSEAIRGVGLTAELIAIVKIEVAGLVEEALAISAWSPWQRLMATPLWQFTIVLHNQGTVSVPLAGNISVQNWQGQVLDSQDYYLGNEFLPQTKRQLNVALTAKHMYWPGLYHAKLKVQFGRVRAVVVESATIIYAPWWSAATTVIILTGLGLIIFYKRKNNV